MTEERIIHIDTEEDDDGLCIDFAWWGTYYIYNMEDHFSISFCDHDAGISEDGSTYTACDDYGVGDGLRTVEEALQWLATHGQQNENALEYKGVIYRRQKAS